MIEEARYIIESHPSYTEEFGPADGGRIGFAIGERVFWTDVYFNDSKRVFEAKRDYAMAIVAALNEGRLFAEVDPTPPEEPLVSPPAVDPDAGWTKFDASKGELPKLFSPVDWIKVRLADGTEEQCKVGFDWLADRGANPIVAYFDEIPF